MDSSVPKTGVAYAANFAVKGDYKELVDFYEKQLPKAGFVLGPKVAIPARKVTITILWKETCSNSVVVSPNAQDPSKFTVHIAHGRLTR